MRSSFAHEWECSLQWQVELKDNPGKRPSSSVKTGRNFLSKQGMFLATTTTRTSQQQQQHTANYNTYPRSPWRVEIKVNISTRRKARTPPLPFPPPKQNLFPSMRPRCIREPTGALLNWCCCYMWPPCVALEFGRNKNSTQDPLLRVGARNTWRCARATPEIRNHSCYISRDADC